MSKDGIKLDPSAVGTAKLLKFFDNLFDSLNGTLHYPKAGKVLRVAVSENSPHLEYWKKAKRDLRHMYFLKNNSKLTPPSLKNWLVTINGIEEIYKDLPREIYFLPGRSLNQDPLENFFGQLRQKGVRNTNPTPTIFQAYFKSLIISNLDTVHSITANCEEDCTKTLSSIRDFISSTINENNDVELNIDAVENTNIPAVRCNYITKLSTAYVSGFIYKKLHHIINECDNCKKSIIADEVSEDWHDFIVAKEYDVDKIPQKLKYCKPHFIYSLYKMYNVTLYMVPRIINEPQCVTILLKYFQRNINFNLNCNCANSELFIKKCINLFVNLCCHNWAKGVNNIINGKAERVHLNNPIYAEALNYRKHRR